MAARGGCSAVEHAAISATVAAARAPVASPVLCTGGYCGDAEMTVTTIPWSLLFKYSTPGLTWIVKVDIYNP